LGPESLDPIKKNGVIDLGRHIDKQTREVKPENFETVKVYGTISDTIIAKLLSNEAPIVKSITIYSK